MINISELSIFLTETIRMAGEIMKEGQNKNFSVSHKSTINDLVTEYDVKVEKFIIQRIKESYPGHAVLGEESGKNDIKSEYVWIIDPIDGTVNYAHHIPLFSCSIALVFQGELTLGAVYNPVTNELFNAVKGKGAYLNGQKITVSDQKILEQSLLVTGFSYEATQSPYTFPLFERIVGQNIPVRRLGSAALDLAYVACGRFEGFWEEGLKPWDIAAGYLLVSEAGGRVTDFNGEEGHIGQRSTWASNSSIHDAFLEVIREVRHI